MRREELLAENPELIEEIEAEAEKMRLENQRLENEITAMIKDNRDAEEVHQLRQEHEQLNEEMENLNRVLDATHNDEKNEEKSIHDSVEGESGKTVNGEDEKNNTRVEDAKESDISRKGEQDAFEIVHEGDTIDSDNEDVLDLDLEDDAASDDVASETSREKSTQKNVDTRSESDQDLSPSVDSGNPFSLSNLLDEVRQQVVSDFKGLADLMKPALEALKPATQILKESISTVVNMVKRYTPKSKNEGKGEDNNPNAVAAIS